MSLCISGLPLGSNERCSLFLSSIKNIGIADAGTVFSDMADFQNLSSWKTKIDTDLSLTLPTGLENYTPNTPDPTVNTTGYGESVYVRAGIPSMTAYLKANPCDFKEMSKMLRGGNYDVFLFHENGEVMGTRIAKYNAAGDAYDIGGLRAKIVATPLALQPIDAIENAYRIDIYFEDVEQFRNFVIVKPAWNYATLLSFIPTGLSINLVTNYDTVGGFAVIEIKERCGDNATAITAFDVVVTDSNGLVSPTGSLADNGDGTWNLTLQKDVVPANLASGDYMVVYITDGTPIIDQVSGSQYIQAL